MRAASLCSPPLSCIWLWRAIIVIIILMGPYAATPPTLRMLGTGHLPVFSFLASSDRTSCTPAKCKPTFHPLPSNQNLERMSCGVYGFDESTKSLLCEHQACSKASMEACRFLSRSLTALLPVCLCRCVHPWPSHPQPNFATTPQPNLDPNPKDPVVLECDGSGCNPTCHRQVGRKNVLLCLLLTSPLLHVQYAGILSQGWDNMPLAFSRSFSFSFSRSFSSFPQHRNASQTYRMPRQSSRLQCGRTKAPRAFWNLLGC